MATYTIGAYDFGDYTSGCTTNATGSTVWLTWATDCTASGTDNAWTQWTITAVDTNCYGTLSESNPSFEAEVKAKALLDEVLTEAQRDEMAKHRYFTVESRTSKRRYRVRTDAGRHGNIDELDEKGRVVARLCCAPRGQLLPHHDALIGQKLSLEVAEDDFRKAANRTAVRAA